MSRRVLKFLFIFLSAKLGGFLELGKPPKLSWSPPREVDGTGVAVSVHPSAVAVSPLELFGIIVLKASFFLSVAISRALGKARASSFIARVSACS